MTVAVEPPGEVVELMLEVPQGQVIRYDAAALVSALGIDDPTRVVVETDGLRRALVTIYPSNPLTQIRAVRREDLVMDRYGRYTVGLYHNGRPARRRLFDPRTGSAQRFMMFGTTGSGKSRSLQLDLAAEKVNGICSWVADLKAGQSVPEARSQVDWFADSQEEAMLMLMSAVSVAEARMRRYSLLGRNSFTLGADPLVHVTVDEANRLLEKPSVKILVSFTYPPHDLVQNGASVDGAVLFYILVYFIVLTRRSELFMRIKTNRIR